MESTTRLALPYPQASDDVSAFPAVAGEQMTALDGSVIVTEGTLTSRPSSTAYGNEYYATDTGQWFKYTGSAWTAMTRGALGHATTSGPFPGTYGYTSGSYQLVEGAAITVAQASAYLLVSGSMSAYTAAVNQATLMYANVDNMTVAGSFLGNIYFETVNIHKSWGGSAIVGPVTAGAHTVGLVVYPEYNELSISSSDGMSLTAVELPN